MAEVEDLSDEPEYSTFKGPSITEEPDLLNEPGPSNPKKPRGKQDVINMKLVASLDNCKVPCLSGKGRVERLPVIITYQQKGKLLGFSTIVESTGKEQALAIFEMLEDLQLTDTVQAICCDTTSTNMGRLKGACVILEQMVGRDLLYFPCRHHIYELVLRSVFEVKISKSSAPEIPLFKKFQKAWPKIKQSNFRLGVEDDYVNGKLQDIELKLNFCFNTIQQKQPRGDYVEFLELMIIFLGGTCPKGNRFHVPGAFHHARWMAKAIYILKIYLFREEFSLSPEEMVGIKDICIFISSLYIEVWFNVPVPEKAPHQDLRFVQQLYAYQAVDKSISQIGLHKFSGHLWYLTPKCAALSFFDADLSFDVKRRMVTKLDETDTKIPLKKIVIKNVYMKNYVNASVDKFISGESKNFVNRFNISTTFLQIVPAICENDEEYKADLEIVQNLKIVNDTAERGVKLVSDYNEILTTNEDSKQYILQILEEYRQFYPDVNKCSLIRDKY
ncbi:uncharacterized protein LOC143372399 [Andrena cerasifolii]|uniref:uncharacterized protein LOC143372399 n=1 Tax=Andrena cerasifolii TaxID=2819439 RepID=UPI0040376B0A